MMDLYKVVIDGRTDDIIGYERLKHGRTDSLFMINDALKEGTGFPLLNGDDMSRMKDAGGTLMWCSPGMTELYYLVDIDFKDTGQWPYDSLPQKFESIGKTIRRDIKLKQVI